MHIIIAIVMLVTFYTAVTNRMSANIEQDSIAVHKGEVIPSGWYFNWHTNTSFFEMKAHTMSHSVTAMSKDGVKVDIELQYSYVLDRHKIKDIAKSYSDNKAVEREIKKTLNGKVAKTIRGQTVKSIYTKIVMDNTLSRIKKVLDKQGISLTHLSIVDVYAGYELNKVFKENAVLLQELENARLKSELHRIDNNEEMESHNKKILDELLETDDDYNEYEE